MCRPERFVGKYQGTWDRWSRCWDNPYLVCSLAAKVIAPVETKHFDGEVIEHSPADKSESILDNLVPMRLVKVQQVFKFLNAGAFKMRGRRKEGAQYQVVV